MMQPHDREGWVWRKLPVAPPDQWKDARPLAAILFWACVSGAVILTVALLVVRWLG